MDIGDNASQIKENPKISRPHLDIVLDYIFQHEFEDFYENPSDNHVYFNAYVVAEGLREANIMLSDALRGIRDE